MYMNFKIFIINILLSTVFLTAFFPLKFPVNPNEIGLLGTLVISSILVIINLFVSVISFITDDLITKLTSSYSLLIEMIVRFCMLGFAPIIFSFFYIKEANKIILKADGIILMVIITIISHVLLKTLFSERITKYDVEKIVQTLFYYGLIILIGLIVLATLMIGVIY